jgi:tetratricopeptide (TPR) repeat protein
VFFSNGSRRVEWLENWARRQRLDAEVQPVSWIEFARAGNRAMDFGQWEDAWKAYAQALAACPEVAPAAVTVLRHACWLFEQGRSGDAADLVDRLRELPEAEQGAVAPIWSRAALVLAVESGDREQAERTLARYSRLIKATASSPDTTGWSRVMPDVLDRARRLTGSDP